MKTLLVIGIGSFMGGVCRYLLYHIIQTRYFSAFPYGTLAVNLLGCFLIGIVYGLSERGDLASEWRVFLATGLLGALLHSLHFQTKRYG